jgi:hypothetical protein
MKYGRKRDANALNSAAVGDDACAM